MGTKGTVTCFDDLLVRLENTKENPWDITMEFIADYLESDLALGKVERIMFAENIREYIQEQRKRV